MKEGTNSNDNNISINHDWQRQTFGHPSKENYINKKFFAIVI